MRVSILSNGPGELWDWARPVIAELRRREHSVSLWLLPCQFASGHERRVASEFGVDKLDGPDSASATWRAMKWEKTDCVAQLGGDLMFGRHLAKITHAPLFCYAYGYKKGMKHVRVFTATNSMASDISARAGYMARGYGIRAIGDLTKDSLSMEYGTFAWEGKNRLLLLPGSRFAIRNAALPWMSEIVRYLRRLVPSLQVKSLFSPFVPESEFAVWRDAGLSPVRLSAGSVMKCADYALTQPGTNTLEMMHCGLPALVAAPYDFLKVIPVSGVAGILSGVPFLGSYLKTRSLRRGLKRNGGFMSWPNRLAGESVMDEIMGNITPEDIAKEIAKSIQNSEKLKTAREKLLSISKEEDEIREKSATALFCDAIESVCGGA
ncbi:hypothetical protein AGMMS50276_07210 [Synergistales bacterium]|nr:hypothetical protein AGMMS50276_07210 [Synergistales bacterium]